MHDRDTTPDPETQAALDRQQAERDARAARLRSRAEKRRDEASSAYARAKEIGSHIPMGQPILVGHHSEKRHRKDIARIDGAMRASVEATREADQLEQRAASVERIDRIASDNPDAIVLLRHKIGELEAANERTKAQLAAARKALKGATTPEAQRAALAPLGLRPRTVDAIIEAGGRLPRLGPNDAAEIRRLKARLADLEAKAAAPAPEAEQIGAVTIEESEGRVRLIFPGKPPEAVRERLKRGGWRWSPTAGAWQRHASPEAWHLARALCHELAAAGAPEAGKTGGAS